MSSSLASQYPALSQEWHAEKNGALLPEDVSPRSSKIVWWQCHATPPHQWQAAIRDRVRSQTGCPTCKRILSSLATKFPALAEEWHPTKNLSLTPEQVTYGSKKKVWWVCSKDPEHEWSAGIFSRARDKRGCPICAGLVIIPKTSLAVLRPDLAAQWHPERNVLGPDEVGLGSSKRVWWRCLKNPSHQWQTSVKNRSGGGKNRSGEKGTGCPYCAGNLVTPETSLKARFPEVAKEWHPTKNAGLRPEEVLSGSGRKVWWRCARAPDHEWRAAIIDRAHKQTGCPVCTGHTVIPKTSLCALYPQLAREWHPTRNGELTPERVRPGSNLKIWWSCQKSSSHVWQTTVANRVAGSRCPICAGRRLSSGTSLAVRCPALVKEWHPTKNGTLRPTELFPGSAKKVWWRCAREPSHEWQAPVSRRAYGAGCPICAGNLVIPETSLCALYPDLAREWHPTKNGALHPEMLRPKSGKRVWWRCGRDPSHEWQTPVYARVTQGTGCPMCSGRVATPKTSLLALHPELAREWHPTRNAPLRPEEIRPGSPRRVWWRCARDPSHEWQATVHRRAREGQKCPVCIKTGKKILGL